MGPLQGEINSKEEGRVARGRGFQVGGGGGLDLDASRKSESKCKKWTKRLDILFKQHYSSKNKDNTSIPPPSPDAPQLYYHAIRQLYWD